MTGGLGDRMRRATGEGHTPPMESVWAAGRRRHRNGRAARLVAGVAALTLVAGGAWAASRSGDGAERLTSGPTSTTAETATTALDGATCDPVPSMEDGPTPPSAQEFLMAGAGRAGGRSDVVTRARVVRSWWLDPVEVGPTEYSWAHRTELEVTDPVLGAEVGDRLVVFDAMSFGGTEEPEGISGPPCHAFEVGDDVVVALVAPPANAPDGPFELNGSSSFFLITDGRFSPELDAARRWLGRRMQPEFGDSELLQQARDLTPSQFMDMLKETAESSQRDGDAATWVVAPGGEPSAGARYFTALVTRAGCAGGHTGRVLEPFIERDATTITITFEAAPLARDVAAPCLGNDAVAVTVDLGGPLEGRELFDGSCRDGGTSPCVEGERRWPR